MKDLLSVHTDDRAVLYRRAGAFFAMLAVAMIYRADTPTDWDSWDYAAQAIRGHSSDLCLGRWWFIALMRAAYLVARGPLSIGPLEGFEVMQVVSAVMMAGALVAAMAWTARLSKSPAAEVILACIILPGPLIGVYASAVMTESMTVLTLGLALLAWERAIAPAACQSGLWALLAGGLLGIMVDVREPAIALCAWPVISCIVDKPARRWQLLGLAVFGSLATLAVGVMMAVAWYPWWPGFWSNFQIWTAKMARERTQFPVSLLTGLGALAWYSFLSAPLTAVLTIPVAIWAAIRTIKHRVPRDTSIDRCHAGRRLPACSQSMAANNARHGTFTAAQNAAVAPTAEGGCATHRRLLAIIVSALPYTVILLMNHDLSINPRFVIPLVWLLSPVVAVAIAGWLIDGRSRYRLRFAATMLAVLGFGVAALAAQWGTVQKYFFDYTTSQARIYQALQGMEERAVVVVGPGAPVAGYFNRLKIKDFEIIGSGWDWPGEGLDGLVADRIAYNKPVYANLNKADWTRTVRESGEWNQLSAVAMKYDLKLPDDGPLSPTENFMYRLKARPQPTSTQSVNP